MLRTLKKHLMCRCSAALFNPISLPTVDTVGKKLSPLRGLWDLA